MLRHLTLQLTDACNYKCPYCVEYGGILTHRRGGEMRYERFVKWAEDFGLWSMVSRKTEVSFTGGEPALSRHAFDIASLFGFVDKVTIGTNVSAVNKVQHLVAPFAKVHVGASFHPTETKLVPFVERMDQLLRRLRASRNDDDVTFDIQVVLMPGQLRRVRVALRLLRGTFGKVYPIPFFGKIKTTSYPNAQYTADISTIPHEPAAAGVPSKGKMCWAGAKSLWVTSTFQVYRCPMVQEHMEQPLTAPAPCPRKTCDCEDYHHLIVP